MKKLVPVLLALALVCALVSVSFAETATDPYFGKFDETVTLKLVVDSADEAPKWTWDDNPWTREWLERFNIKIEIMWNTGTAEEFNTKFAMAMLTDELPDFMKLSTKQFKELQASGKLKDITEAYDEHIYPFLKNEVINPMGEALQQSAFVDGKRYGIASASYGTNTRSIYIRKDYLEAVGAEVPTTIEEVIELGKLFVDEGLCKYALPLQSTVTGDGYSDLQAVANAYGAYPGIWVENEEGALEYSPTTEGMKRALDVYKDLYDKGYISPTFATDVGDNLTAYITNGEVGILTGDFWVATWPLPIVDENEQIIEWEIVPVVASEENADFHVQGTGSMADVTYYCVSSACEYPEAVMILLNHICSVSSDPDLAEPERFHTVKDEDGNDVGVHMQNPMDLYLSVPHVNMFTAVAVMDALNGDIDALKPQSHFQQQYDNVLKYRAAIDAGDKVTEKATWGTNKLFGGEESIFYCFYKNYAAGNYIWDARTVKTENYERLWGTLTQYENTFYVNYIGGTETTTFEEFVEEWYGMGGQLLTDELNGD